MITEDIPYLAKMRGTDMATELFWTDRITGYINCTHHPQHALNTRVIYVAILNESIVGFIAGHLTERLGCEGELQWINVTDSAKRTGIASGLVRLLAQWFVANQVHKICVDPGNDIARAFYKKNGATMLNDHWMYWHDIKKIL